MTDMRWKKSQVQVVPGIFVDRRNGNLHCHRNNLTTITDNSNLFVILAIIV